MDCESESDAAQSDAASAMAEQHIASFSMNVFCYKGRVISGQCQRTGSVFSYTVTAGSSWCVQAYLDRMRTFKGSPQICD